MNVNEIVNELDRWAPFTYQETWDNAGLIAGDPGMEVSGIMISLDTTAEVIREARERNCNLVVSHHPLIFKGITRFTPGTPEYTVLRHVIRNDIAVVAMHTNVDNRAESLNHYLGKLIGLSNIGILRPKKGGLKKLVTFCPPEYSERVKGALFNAGAGHIGKYDCCSFTSPGQGSFRASEEANPFIGEKNTLHIEQEVRVEVVFPVDKEAQILTALRESHPYEEVAFDVYSLDNSFHQVGSGISGTLQEALPPVDFLAKVKQVIGIPVIRHSKPSGHPIQRVAICSGAGTFLLPDVLGSGMDAYLTGDLTYHTFQTAANHLLLADIGHFESERFFTGIVKDLLIEKFPTFAVLISQQEINPVNYFKS